MSAMPSMFKVLILGDPSVGKTAILNQFVDREFSTKYKPTIGADFLSKQIEVDGKFYTLQIWDTAGQDRYQSLGSTFYRGADLCIIVYDISKRETFENIQTWMDRFNNYTGFDTGDFPIMILGNKSDIVEREIEKEEGEKFANEKNLKFFEVSAKTADNITKSFEEGIKMTIEYAHKNEVIAPLATVSPTVNVTSNSPRRRERCCK